MSSQEDGEAAAQESDQEADSPAQSSGSADSHDADESASGNESSSGSEQLELEAEEERLEVADVDLEAPRAKRRRGAAVGSQDEGCLAQPSDTPGQLICLLRSQLAVFSLHVLACAGMHVGECFCNNKQPCLECCIAPQ